MLKRSLILILTGLTFSVLYAKSDGNNGIEKFFYTQGYKQGYKDGYQKGYRDALLYAERKIEEYTAKIKAYEAGKYLIYKQKITYPQVYQVTDANGNVKIIVKGCQIQKPLSPGDILFIPNMLNGYESNSPMPNPPKYVADRNVTNAIVNNGLSSVPKLPEKTGADKNVIFLEFPNTSFYRKILDNANLIYAIDNSTGKIKVLFQNRKNAMEFIKEHNFKLGKDYF